MKIKNTLLVSFALMFAGFFSVASAQPAVTPVIQGNSATLTASADGTAPFAYAWKKGATVLPQTTAAITLTNVSAADSATYTVTISNAFGSATASATLSIGQPPTNPKISVIQQVIAWLKSIFTRNRS